MDHENAPTDPDNPQTPLEQTIEPAELEQLRNAAREAGANRIPRPRSRPQSTGDLETGDLETGDDTEPLTPLEPTLEPGDLQALRDIAKQSGAALPERPRPPAPEPMSEAPRLLEPPVSPPPAPPARTEPVVPEPASSSPPPMAQPPATVDDRFATAGPMWRLVVPTAFLLAVVMLLANILPLVLIHWRRSESQADAEAAYLKRRAELRAEAEAAGEQLDRLDSKANLVSLGFRNIVGKVSPSVVNIASLRDPASGDDVRGGTLTYDPEKNQRYLQAVMGSGVLFKPGYLLTNNHVVAGADRLRIIFATGRVLGVDGSAVVTDPITDLAVVKLPDDVSDALKEDMRNTVEFANSDKEIEVGDWALAIGSPLGLRQTVTAGILSAKDRLIDKLDMVELLQTDAAINPGNSGGPLFDQRGRVIGINVALASENGVNRGIGFAIPSNTASKIANDLITHGEVVRGYLGIGLEEYPLPRARTLGMDGGAVMVLKVRPGEPGDKAGLKVGDIISKYAGQSLQPYSAVRQLRQLIVDTPPGRDVPIEVYRDGRRQDVAATIGRRPVLEK